MKLLKILIAILTLSMGLMNNSAAGNGSVGKSSFVEVKENYAYVAKGTQMTIVDISEPSMPIIVSQMAAFSDGIRNIKVSSNVAFLAAGKAGIIMIDITDSYKPELLGSFYTEGTACGIFINNNYAYIADGNRGLQIIDISNPENLLLLGNSPTEGWDWDLTISGNNAYIAADEAGLRIVDISDPLNLHEIGKIKFPNDALGISVSKNYAYVAAAGAGLRIVDISNPEFPKEVASFSNTFAKKIRVLDDYVYVATEREGLLIIDVSEPTEPYAIGMLKSKGYTHGAYPVGDQLYLADGAGGIFIAKIIHRPFKKVWGNFFAIP